MGWLWLLFADQAGAAGTAAALCLRDQQNEDKDCFVPLALIFSFFFFFSLLAKGYPDSSFSLLEADTVFSFRHDIL